ncbi:NYN domain-containing protein [Leptolyngbya sp. AN02str]|uniref:NYN domain-containing protein n=1 Tax=Leptolyngbya sp. AN02str TaxID=3423363 RepID=UPI003D314329
MPRKAPEAILLVDGYNVIGAWADLKAISDREGLEEARRTLVERLLSYSAANDYETELVFDSHYQETPGSRERLNSYFSIYYTDFRQSADTYIEWVCSQYRYDIRKHSQRLIVATSDRVHQQTVQGYGANWISAQQLRTDVECTTVRVRHRQKQPKKSSGRFLARSLDPVAQQRLAEMRKGLNLE